MVEEPEHGEDTTEGAAVFPIIPEELGVNPLLLGVVHAAVFLVGSEDEVVRPDAAEEALQYLVTYLRRLSGPRLQKVREDMAALTGYAKQQQWPKQDVRFLKEFLGEFGIDGESKG